MEFLTRLFLESPLRLGLFSFILFAVILLWRTRWENVSARRWALPATLATILLLFIVQKIVVTDREDVVAALRTFATAIEADDIDAVDALVDVDFRQDDLDAADFMSYMERFLEVWEVRDVRFVRCNVTIEGEKARMTLTASATAERQNEVGQTHYGVWILEWRRRSMGWKLLSVDPQKIDGIDLTSYRDIPIA